ncbi:hypothetical protein [Paenibacillus thermotolerans]|uniref:hypothetical protein n=1 Tax=Paenibacillus thermotolerans TaxID=3027807 RepID=UPI002368B799|nr:MULTISPECIES: hypothetical protein [unclassified Paenibacillus]
MIITEREAKVLEVIRANGKIIRKDIVKILDLSRDIVDRVIARLISVNALSQLGRGKYKVLIDQYEIGNVEKVEITNPIVLDTTNIPAHIREYIKAHDPYVSRSKLSRRTGVPKLLLNQLLYEIKGV